MQQMQSRVRKVATLARTGEKGRALAAARNAPPVPVTEQIVQEIKSLLPADPEPPAPVSAPVSALFLSEVAEHVPTTLRKMPRLSEPGPLGMRAEHWYDFGSLAGNSDLFVQVIAHIAAAAVPSSVLQYLKAGQITPLAKPTGGHRPLLMMSFLHRLALKSVMGANTMIKTIQYLAEADNSRVLVALDLKAVFQNVSRRAMLYSIAQTDADLAAVFSEWYTGTTEHRMHYDSAYTKISANSGWIRVVLCQRVDSQLSLAQYSVQSWRSFARITTQAPNFLPTWTIGTCGLNRSASYRQTLLSQQPPDQSILLYSPPKHKCGKALVRTPNHLSSKTRSHSHSVAWEDIYKSMATLSPALLFWESRPTWRKQYNAFRKLPPHLQTLRLRDSMCRQ